jgi:hypothetical protein
MIEFLDELLFQRTTSAAWLSRAEPKKVAGTLRARRVRLDAPRIDVDWPLLPFSLVRQDAPYTFFAAFDVPHHAWFGVETQGKPGGYLSKWNILRTAADGTPRVPATFLASHCKSICAKRGESFRVSCEFPSEK